MEILLKKLIKEDQGIPSFVIEIENPKKLWKKIKTENQKEL